MAIGYMLPLLDLADVMKVRKPTLQLKTAAASLTPNRTRLKVTDEEAELMFGIDRSTALTKPSELFSVWPGLTAGLVTAGEGGAERRMREWKARAKGKKMDRHLPHRQW